MAQKGQTFHEVAFEFYATMISDDICIFFEIFIMSKIKSFENIMSSNHNSYSVVNIRLVAKKNHH